ncbi:single-stranded DNA-binding protein [Heyndrickxia sporothermodurans]|uniref:single-stranded DNA-binding protein n=1 Tax=Heyndrickxia sporothermodurans TaxID=46224 RepID=UPI002DB6C864|nr:single-stranded DNA-binding protein [Heyndrickxia sporothermodurans]MEB6550192.1 single-stranded DNA-binding protein [Heyndrickxia sporothermodurans]
MYYQSITLIGRTTSKANLRFITDGKAVANFILAINRDGSSNNADFIPCVIWEDKAKNFTNKFGKGSLVLIEGKLRSTQIQLEEGGTKNELQFEVHSFKQMEKPKPVTTNNNEE